MREKKVLVIEDNHLNMKLIRSLLEIGKYRCLEAGDAETGLKIAAEVKPDLILMDIQLPGMDGLTATRHIKQDDGLKHIPVIALTSYAMKGDEEKAKEAGCEGYITKPVDTRKFLKSVSRILLKKEGSPKIDLNSKEKILAVDDELHHVHS
jgi:CheY-like chemotaxis protein